MIPFLKWAGGKRQLLETLRLHIPSSYDVYYEPFLGAGALFLDTKPKTAVLGDVNKQLINLWCHVRDNLDILLLTISWLDRTPCTKERYKLIRKQYNSLKEEQSFAVAAAMLWLNKHCYNGLWRVNSKGNFNVPWNNKTGGCNLDIENLTMISAFLQGQVTINNAPYQETCAAVKKDDFIYFDPPYDPVSKTASFTAYTKEAFGDSDQQGLAAFVRTLSEKQAKVLISNNDTPLIRELYSDYDIIAVPVRRNISRDGSTRTGQEVLIKNY